MSEKAKEKLKNLKPDDIARYCGDCHYWERAHHEHPCSSCFGMRAGQFFEYKNWKPSCAIPLNCEKGFYRAFGE